MTRPPRIARALRVTLGLALIVSFGAACGPEEGGPPDETVADAAGEEDVVEAEPLIVAAAVPRELPPGGFPHGAHRDLVCTTCHTSVRGHVGHLTSSCVDCHAVPASFAALEIPSERDCMTCHHLRQPDRECEQCHVRATLADGLTVRAPIETSVRAAPVERDVQFDHALHAEQVCSACHSQSAFEAVESSCGTCHDDHHTERAACSSCHVDVDPAVHDDRTHRGCSGSGCHVDAAVEALPPTRALCLTCHAAQTDHEPEGDCASCHGIRVWSGRPVRENG